MKRLFLTTFILIVLVVALGGAGSQAGLAQAPAVLSLPPVGGSWQYWDPTSVDPAHRSLHAVDMLSASDGWAVGEQVILRWNGSAWALVPDPSEQTLTDVVAISASDAWAIGDGGDILRWNGSAWNLIDPVPGNWGLTQLSLVAPDNIWACGYGGTLLHWDGGQWSAVSSPADADLRAISMLSADDGWAVGYGGEMLRYVSGAWQQMPKVTYNTLSGVAMVSAADGWAVGDWGTLLRWNGSAWQATSGPTLSSYATLSMVKAHAADDVWISGFDQGWYNLYHNTGGASWNVFQNNLDGVSYHDIGFVPGTYKVEAWIAGDAATLLHLGVTPYAYNQPYAKTLMDVTLTTPTSGWAVSTLFPIYHGDALRWNGAAWASQSTMDGKALALAPGSNDQDGWEVGVFGEMSHFSGGAWTQTSKLVSNDLNDVDLLSASEGWAVGGGPQTGTSVILRLHNGAWSALTSPVTVALNGVDLSDASHGWAVGDAGAMLRWDGSNWTSVPPVTSADLNCVVMLSTHDGFAAGAGGVILRYNDGAWNPIPSPTGSEITALQMRSTVYGWAVGFNQILYWNGMSWSVFPTPVYGWLQGITVVSFNDVWAVGQAGRIMHYTAPPAAVSASYPSGQPGSTFAFSGSNYLPFSAVAITVNGQALGLVGADYAGNFTFRIATSGGAPGSYFVTAGADPSALARFSLDPAAPQHDATGSDQLFNLPAGIAFDHTVYLSVVRR